MNHQPASPATMGERISLLRRQAELSQDALAEKLGVSRQAVSKWETDQCAPDTYNLIALSRLLGASLEYIALGTQTTSADAALPENESATVPVTTQAEQEQLQEKPRPRASQTRRKFFALKIVTIVLALLLVIQSLFFAWLYPRPWLSVGEHYLLSDRDVRNAAATVERAYFFRSIYTRTLLLNLRCKDDGKAEQQYLEEHPEVDERDVIIFHCIIFIPYIDGVHSDWQIAVERDHRGQWHITAEGVL